MFFVFIVLDSVFVSPSCHVRIIGDCPWFIQTTYGPCIFSWDDSNVAQGFPLCFSAHFLEPAAVLTAGRGRGILS